MTLNDALELMRRARAECEPFWQLDNYGNIPSEFVVVTDDGDNFWVQFEVGPYFDSYTERVSDVRQWEGYPKRPVNMAKRWATASFILRDAALRTALLTAFSKELVTTPEQ